MAMFEGNLMTLKVIIDKVFEDIRNLYNLQFTSAKSYAHSWPEFYHQIVVIKKISRFKLVKWAKPIEGNLKLNTDGCSKWNPGCVAGREVLQDCHRNLVLAFLAAFGEATNV